MYMSDKKGAGFIPDPVSTTAMLFPVWVARPGHMTSPFPKSDNEDNDLCFIVIFTSWARD